MKEGFGDCTILCIAHRCVTHTLHIFCPSAHWSVAWDAMGLDNFILAKIVAWRARDQCCIWYLPPSHDDWCVCFWPG